MITPIMPCYHVEQFVWLKELPDMPPQTLRPNAHPEKCTLASQHRPFPQARDAADAPRRLSPQPKGRQTMPQPSKRPSGILTA